MAPFPPSKKHSIQASLLQYLYYFLQSRPATEVPSITSHIFSVRRYSGLGKGSCTFLSRDKRDRTCGGCEGQPNFLFISQGTISTGCGLQRFAKKDRVPGYFCFREKGRISELREGKRNERKCLLLAKCPGRERRLKHLLIPPHLCCYTPNELKA